MTATHFAFARSNGRRRRARKREGLSALADATASLAATFREWRRRVRDRAELAALDDRALRDIGISRAEAIHLSSKPFWRE